MAIARYYSSIGQATALAGGISNTNLTMQVQAPTGFPTSYPYTLAVDYGTSSEELVDVTNASGTTLTITRGVDGTSAQTHSIGAVVRHTSSGRDFADLQGHIAATSGVHGVSGTLVGTSDAQTLANKTLTSPSISGATLSGTLSGSPTFSGAPVFSGAPSLNAGGALAGTFTGAPVFSGGPSFSAARPLFTRAAAANAALGTRVTGDTVDRLEVDADGKHLWGTGGAAGDTTLYRNSVGELKTDTALTVVGSSSSANFPSGAWTGWTPTWATSTGLHAPSYGNSAVAGSYLKLGRGLFFNLSIVFGTLVGFGTGATTSDNWILSLPGAWTGSAMYAGTSAICGMGRASIASGATLPFTVHVDSGGTNLLLDTAGGRVDAGAVTAGTFDSVTPWTWVIGGSLQMNGFLETTT